jgi:cellulose biosynthesis protein BcsQ
MEDGMSEPQTSDSYDLSRVVAVANGKGGVFKTSIVANVGGHLANLGMRVLVIDLDTSGNLKLDLGLAESPENDSGKSILDAVWSGSPLKVVKDVRPDLDFVFGGRALKMLPTFATSDMAEDLPTGSVSGEFAARVGEIADDYDLILIDCPPNNVELQDTGLAAACWVLIPTKTDPGSWDGLLEIGPRVRRARANNPAIKYLGVVVTGHNPSATRIWKATEERLREVEATAPLLKTVIRHSETTAHDCRLRGQLAHELARDASASQKMRLLALRSRRPTANSAVSEATPVPVTPMPGALSGTANSVAGDYAKLAAEICALITVTESGSTEPDIPDPVDGAIPAVLSVDDLPSAGHAAVAAPAGGVA